jgi:hypothetical protein
VTEITCPQCQHGNSPDARFCNQCAAALPQRDPNAPTWQILRPWRGYWASSYPPCETLEELLAMAGNFHEYMGDYGSDQTDAVAALVSETDDPNVPEGPRLKVHEWHPLVRQLDGKSFTAADQPADAPDHVETTCLESAGDME